MTSYHEAQRQKQFVLQKTRRAVIRAVEFSKRSGVAAANIKSALDDFITKDKALKEQYENNKENSLTPIQRTRVEADNSPRKK